MINKKFFCGFVVLVILVGEQSLVLGKFAEEAKAPTNGSSVEETVHRMKRWLIFNNGGLVKVTNRVCWQFE